MSVKMRKRKKKKKQQRETIVNHGEKNVKIAIKKTKKNGKREEARTKRIKKGSE